MIKITKTLPVFTEHKIELDEVELVKILRNKWKSSIKLVGQTSNDDMVSTADEEGVFISDGHWGHWTSWPHGSGTTTKYQKLTDREREILGAFFTIQEFFEHGV